MRFIDLFAGLGGFHVALSSLGHRCVFACERDIVLNKLYTENYGIECYGDIKNIPIEDIPEHDILCAGFPCQPFSKAGKQKGIDDIDRGDLVYDILDILSYRRPKYFILENVPNLKKHDREKTWNFLESALGNLGYDVKEEILSPHQFNVPQIRNRIFIVGSLSDDTLQNFSFPSPIVNPNIDIRQILDINPSNVKTITQRQIECLNIWQQILNAVPASAKLPSFPIWGMEFGATYPIDGPAPYQLSQNELSMYKGAFGASLKGMSKEDQLKHLPSYAIYNEASFPSWKRRFIMGIRSFFNQYHDLLEPYITQLTIFPPSWQKLEWNCLDEERNIFNYIIQFRASGIRIKRTNYSPALVLTSTQIPIIGWEQRYITLREAQKLQHLENIKMPTPESKAYRALGNAVNVRIVTLIAEKLIGKTK